MLQPRLHVHNDHVVLAEHQRRQNGLEHHMLRADAAAAAGFHRAHHQQLDAVDVTGELIGDIAYLRVELEEFVGIRGAGAFLHQLAHFGNGDDGIDFLLRQAQRQSQIGVRVHVGGQHGTPFGGVQPGQCGGEGGLAHAALSGDRYFHWFDLSSDTAFIRCPAPRAWPRCRRSSCRPGSRYRCPR